MSRIRTRIPRIPAREDTPARGFVLIGVVMFVLALTILGLSLFSLSSYEGQFLNRSYASDQALYAAQSGVDHVKFLLAKRDSMALASTLLFPAEVVYARAMRAGSTDSIHSISSFPPGTPVTIRVMASVSGERRMVEASYVPTSSANIYKGLVTVQDTVYVKAYRDADEDPQSYGGYSLCGAVHMDGQVRVGVAPHGGPPPGNEQYWYLCAQGMNPLMMPATVPMPDVQSFFDAHLAEATPIAASSDNFILTDPPPPGGAVHYYVTDGQDGTHHYSLEQGDAASINVHGIAVWMLPHGGRFENPVRVNGTSNDCLVIVAGPGFDPISQYTGAGLWFFGSLYAPDLSVILVSNGRIQIEHALFSNQTNSTRIDYGSIFAKSVWFGGPKIGSGYTFQIQHDAGDPRDAAGGLIDQLCDVGALPNSETGSVKFQPVAGTWKELNPDHP